MIDSLLKDVVQHTSGLGIFDVVKITGDTKTTVMDGIAEDKSVVMHGEFNKAVSEFTGTFGLPNLSKLNTILSIPEYKENPQIVVQKQMRNNESVPVSIEFENAAKDFKNEYRLMSPEIVNAKLPPARFKGANWDVITVPTVSNIQRFRFQSQANTDEVTFKVKVENGNLKFYFGDHSSHAGNFVFAAGVTGNLKKDWAYPVQQTLSVLGSAGDKILNFSDAGAMMIVVDSGLARYEYIFPALVK